MIRRNRAHRRRMNESLNWDTTLVGIKEAIDRQRRSLDNIMNTQDLDEDTFGRLGVIQDNLVGIINSIDYLSDEGFRCIETLTSIFEKEKL